MKLVHSFTYCLAAVLTAGATASSAQTVEDLKRRTNDIVALLEAENTKSAFCKGFIGKTVAPMQFDRLALALKGIGAKGEFESTAQYELRRRAKGAPVTEALLLVPMDRDFVKYDADARAMIVSAGAFVAKELIDDEEADMHLQGMISTAGI